MIKQVWVSLSLVLGLTFAASFANAAGDCEYRFSQNAGEFQVIPSGFTGQMTCNKADTKKLLDKVTKEVLAQLEKEKAASGSGMLPSLTVKFGNLQFYPSLRAEIANELKKDSGWDKSAGKALPDSINDPVASSFLRSSFVQALTKKNMMVDESAIENIKTAPAKELKIAGIKSGTYPQSGELRLVVHKLTPTTAPAPSKAPNTADGDL